ncbi:hypothetical protein GCM10020366_02220 [Saccharopolyspora gregorii]|uniref:Uncharacterized protein n=1 Tax=Saccharopolyspora gregorii TaxID=33914 RepID=A0ABP6RH22_9PSEU
MPLMSCLGTRVRPADGSRPGSDCEPVIEESERYIRAVEAMSVPRSARVWDAQDEVIGCARALIRAAGSVRELILRAQVVRHE